jgi:hypothetical protein
VYDAPEIHITFHFDTAATAASAIRFTASVTVDARFIVQLDNFYTSLCIVCLLQAMQC